MPVYQSLGTLTGICETNALLQRHSSIHHSGSSCQVIGPWRKETLKGKRSMFSLNISAMHPHASISGPISACIRASRPPSARK